jgi:hypothetical protein
LKYSLCGVNHQTEDDTTDNDSIHLINDKFARQDLILLSHRDDLWIPNTLNRGNAGQQFPLLRGLNPPLMQRATDYPKNFTSTNYFSKLKHLDVDGVMKL